MTGSTSFNPARALAVGVLARVLGGQAFAASALDEALAKARLPARDSGLATHVVYGTLRHHLMLEEALRPLLRGDTQVKVRALLLAGAFEKLVLGTPPHAVVNEYVSLARSRFGKLSGLVNAVLRRVELPAGSPEVSASMPGWLLEEFEGAFGERTADVTEDLLRPAPLWLWLTERGVSVLEEDGALVEPGFGDVYRVSLAGPLRQSRAYREGQAQPINPASLAVVDALGDVRGVRVLDLAGGAGVKAAMLALRGAQVVSVDVEARKHTAARENLARLGVTGEFMSWDLRTPPDVPAADVVLLDAPCTGSGTLRAHPEIKLRLTPEVVGEMAGLQRQLLESAASLVRPGGTLLYSVCSVAQSEGPGVVGAFLSAHPEFRVSEIELGLPVVRDEFGVRTVPVEGLDGFYLSRFIRSEDIQKGES